MKTHSYLQTGRIHLATLLLALLLSIVATAYFLEIDKTSLGKPDKSLQQTAQLYHQSLLNRINIADQALELIARDTQSPNLPRLASPYFKNVSVVNTAGQLTPLIGTQLNLPDQREAIAIHLARGNPALLTLANSGGAGHSKVILLRGIMLDSSVTAVVAAEFATDYLWQTPPPLSGNLLVLGKQGQLLYSTAKPAPPSLNPALKKLFQQPLRATSGDLQWSENGNQGLSSYITLPMHERYAADDWHVVATTLLPPMLSGINLMTELTAASILLSLFLAWGVFLRLHRAKQAGKTTTGTGSGTQLALFQPPDIVRAMDEFDRAILSNANLNNMIDLTFTHVPKIIPCILIAITSLDDSSPDQQISFVNTLDKTQPIELPKLNNALRQHLDSEPNGYLVEQPDQEPFLKPLADLGAVRLHLFPIFREGSLAAILHFGLPENKWLTAGEHHYARSFADRLGVALTSVMRGKELYLQEHFDPVTGLPNRAFCRDRLSQEISRARRKKLLIAIININLIGFKKINDSLGYAGGDDILTQIAQRLKSSLRESDVVSRFGNDEFVILLPDLNNANEITKVAGKLVDTFAEHFAHNGHNMHINAALGISIYPNDGQSIDQLLHNAEMAMTRIKSSGHTQYGFYEDNMNSKAIERLKLEHDLRQGMGEDQLFLVYQPQIDLRTGKIAGVEALVRWKHPTRGMVFPSDFIPIAEETGLIIKMSEIIRHTACKQYIEWHDKGVAPPRIAVNVSSQDLRRKTFSEEVLATLELYNVPTSAIELEITESMFVDASGGIVDVLRGLQSQGFLIAIDDFGTGYSSLSYLGLLPFDILKVDRSFVLGIGKPAEKIVSVIVDVAHTFEKKVIAEGVDSDHQHKYLEGLGCEIIQGYLFSKPLMASEFETYATKMAA